MYNNILLRSSDPGGFNGWVQALNSGQVTRAQVALGFLDSGEFQGLSASQNRVDISLLYFDMLQRDPDPGGFSDWVGVLNSGVSLTSVIDAFINSPEYQAGFDDSSCRLLGRLTDADWVKGNMPPPPPPGILRCGSLIQLSERSPSSSVKVAAATQSQNPRNRLVAATLGGTLTTILCTISALYEKSETMPLSSE